MHGEIASKKVKEALKANKVCLRCTTEYIPKHYILQFLLRVSFGVKIDAEGVIGFTKCIRSNKTRNRDY